MSNLKQLSRYMTYKTVVIFITKYKYSQKYFIRNYSSHSLINCSKVTFISKTSHPHTQVYNIIIMFFQQRICT